VRVVRPQRRRAARHDLRAQRHDATVVLHACRSSQSTRRRGQLPLYGVIRCPVI
jgi:hypothetical protein